jgi:uncharacterized membrane protein YvbJ
LFCPNCHLESYEDGEYCNQCGVKLEYKASNTTSKEENVPCPYCGNTSDVPKCKHCSHWIDKSAGSNKDTKGSISAIPGELKNLKWDDTFVKTNLVIIVGIMGIIVIMMLFMN